MKKLFPIGFGKSKVYAAAGMNHDCTSDRPKGEGEGLGGTVESLVLHPGLILNFTR